MGLAAKTFSQETNLWRIKAETSLALIHASAAKTTGVVIVDNKLAVGFSFTGEDETNGVGSGI